LTHIKLKHGINTLLATHYIVLAI